MGQSRGDRVPHCSGFPGALVHLRGLRGSEPGLGTVHATHRTRSAGRTLDPRQGARVAAVRAARRLAGAHGGGVTRAPGPAVALPGRLRGHSRPSDCPEPRSLASAPPTPRHGPHLPAHVQQRVIVFIVQLLLAQGRRHLRNLSPRQTGEAVVKRVGRCAALPARLPPTPQRPLAARSRTAALGTRLRTAHCAPARPRAEAGRRL